MAGTTNAVATVYGVVPPYQRPGYKAPERMTALDYVTPKASWPLVWLLDIGGYDAVSSKASGQASFSLTSAHGGGAQTRLQCNAPLAEGRLFDKEGTYLVVVVPAEDEDRVRAIMSAAKQGNGDASVA